MSQKTIFTINATIMGIFAYISILLPSTVISGYGIEFNELVVVTIRYCGSGLLALALLVFFLKDLEYNSDVKAIVLALLLSNIIGFIVALKSQFSNVVNTNLGWLYIIVYGFMSFTFSYIYFKKEAH